MHRLFTIFLLSILTLFTYGQIENVIFTLHLKNGDIVTGTTDITEIPLKTSYGNLNFPVGDINSINIGLQNSNFDKARLLDLLDKLDFGNTKEKERAFDEIIKMNEGAIPFIKSYLQNSKQANANGEISVEVLYEVMLAKFNVSRNYSLYDEIVFNGKNSVEGTFDFLAILLETDYGRIRIDRKSIESIDIKILAEEGFTKDNIFKVFANQFVSGNKENGWLNTSILVKKGEQIKISADGSVSLASLSSNTYSPDGGINGAPGPTDKKINYGQLLFKISQTGKPIKAGESITYTANKTGIIFLSVYETVYNTANTGYYNAKVSVK
jgi:hypothetical protein